MEHEVAVDAERADEESCQRCRAASTELEAYAAARDTLLKYLLHLGGEILGELLLHAHIRVARDAERRGIEHAASGEEFINMADDHILYQHEGRGPLLAHDGTEPIESAGNRDGGVGATRVILAIGFQRHGHV